MGEIGMAATPAGLAAYYDGLLDGLVIDDADQGDLPPGIAILATDTLMRDAADQRSLAADTVAFAHSLR